MDTLEIFKDFLEPEEPKARESPAAVPPEPEQKQKYSVFLRTLFPDVTPACAKLMNELKKHYKEDEIMGALELYYKFNNESPCIGDWCGRERFAKMESAVTLWHMMCEARKFNELAAKEAGSKKQIAEPIVYGGADRYCRNELDRFWEKNR